MSVGGGGAWPGFETTRRAAYQQLASLVWRAPEGLEGLAAVPVESDHSEPKARVGRSRGRAAAHRHSKQPGPTKHTQRPEHQRCDTASKTQEL